VRHLRGLAAREYAKSSACAEGEKEMSGEESFYKRMSAEFIE
jgi:hypothetical protein